MEEQDWAVFGVELPGRVLAAIRADAEARYPKEACGLVFGDPSGPRTDRVVPIGNVSDDPGRFAFDEREHLLALEAAEAEGRAERVVYHSHPDAGAYLSAVDRAAIAPGGRALMPHVLHLVVEMRGGRAGEMAAFRYNPDSRSFDEAHFGPPTLPDLELRAGPSERPIPAVGGQIVGRRLDPEEAARLRGLAEGARLSVDHRTAQLIDHFELGHLSPLTGFQRPDEARTVEALGRTPRGVPWRSPVVLEVPRAPDWKTGQVIELIGPDDAPRALMVVAERRSSAKGVVLGGPLFAYPSGRPDVRDLRAAWLSLGAERILAVPASADPLASPLDRYDALLLSPRWVEDPGAERLAPTAELAAALAQTPGAGLVVRQLAEIGGDPWLNAAMAQNQGATHILVSSPAIAREIEDALQIKPILPRVPPSP